jgi:F-type H+-transporting ATPase subunit gamma
MASLRDTRRRIASVKNTRQITRAMKLVAGAKLRRATEAATAAKPYQRTLTRVLARVVQSVGEVEHPLLMVPDNKDDVVVIVLTSDRGLCGGFNNQLCRFVEAKMRALTSDGKRVELVCYGKKGRDFFKSRGYAIKTAHVDIDPVDYPKVTDALADHLVVEMGNDGFSRAFVAFSEFQNVMTQTPSFEQVLPMKVATTDDDAQTTTGGDYIYEPGGDEILGRLLPMALRTRLLQSFLETQAGEQASRMTAMDNATRNASDLIDDLTLIYNRARQAAITTELTEIVSGAEAL